MSEAVDAVPLAPLVTDVKDPPSKKKIPIQIRHATRLDIPQTSEIQRVAFKDFPMMQHIYRDTDKYVDEVKRFLNLTHRDFLVTPDHYVFVAIDQDSGRVIAYALWVFKNGPKAPQSWIEQKPTSWLDWLEEKLLHYEYRYYSKILDHKTIPGGADELFAGYDAAKGDYVKKPQLYLRHLAVDPACQGMGVGRALLRHGSDVARELGLPLLLLCASPEAKLLYDQEGFTHIADVVQAKGKPDEVRTPFLVLESRPGD